MRRKKKKKVKEEIVGSDMGDIFLDLKRSDNVRIYWE